MTECKQTITQWLCSYFIDWFKDHDRISLKLKIRFKLVMLGLKQPCHKKHSPEKVGQQLAKDHGVNYWRAQYGSVTTGWISVIHVFSAILAIITGMLKFRLVSNKTNLSCPNCYFFAREWLNCLSNSAFFSSKVSQVTAFMEAWCHRSWSTDSPPQGCMCVAVNFG